VSFEVRYTDLAARIGLLNTPHGILETPAFIPVVHPVRQAISPQYLKRLGFRAVITNAYITLRHHGDEAKKKGIHNIINYDGIVMTDSGGYQLLEYGSLNIEPAVIAQFEKDIKSDICIPLDEPTGYKLEYEIAKERVEQTLKNAKETLALISEHSITKDITHDAIWGGPIQGGEHLDLITYSANALDKIGFELFALGSPVELMEAYEFSMLGQMIAAAKRAIPTKPIHLFGAGHPLTIPFAIALGCDMFDSASYMLYAKDNRYIHTNGTSRLEEISYLPCPCPICSSYTVRELLGMDRDSRVTEIAKHNLYMLKAEVCAVKQAIMDGRLWEYIMQKARSHPKLMEAMSIFKNFELLEEGTPLFKEKAIFLYDQLDQYRPEVKRFRRMVSEFRPRDKKKLILYPEPQLHPFYSTKEYFQIVKKFPDAQICTYNPFLGVIPVEISDIFPSSHNLFKPTAWHPAKEYVAFSESLNAFLSTNRFEEIIIVADHFMRQVVDHEDDNKAVKKLKPKIINYRQDIIFQL
jgi:7-cyano-7-deazaguanine tRNA-ribosyltransferase